MLENAFDGGAISARRLVVPAPARASCVVVVVLAFTLVGRALENVLDPRAGALTMTALLRLEDVSVTYRTAEGPSPPCAGSRSAVEAGQPLGVAGRVGVRQVHAGGDRAAAHARVGEGRGSGPARRRGRAHDEVRPTCARSAGPRRPSSSRARCTRSTRCRRSASRSPSRPAARQRRSTRRSADKRVGELLEQVGLPAPAGVVVPAPALRRPEAARHDRDGAGLPPAADHRRRADDGAGRDGAGPGARPAHRPGARARASGSSSSAMTCRCSARPATGSR